jgi:hypothetical protein
MIFLFLSATEERERCGIFFARKKTKLVGSNCKNWNTTVSQKQGIKNMHEKGNWLKIKMPFFKSRIYRYPVHIKNKLLFFSDRIRLVG